MTRLLLIMPVLTLFLSCGNNSSADKNEASSLTPSRQSSPTRIISFAPNITEILYELGLGDNIAGVTQFCDYPPKAAQKEKIGGYANHNYEMILRLKPDYAVILKEQRELIPFFDKHSIGYAAIGSDSVDEIIESIQKIAKVCSVADKGDSIAQGMRQQIKQKSPPSSALTDRPKVLLCVGRDNIGGGAVNKCFAAGALSFYNELIEAAGGVNVLKDVQQPYPSISAEAVIRLNPDIIIDISHAYLKDAKQAANCGDWEAFKTVTAVQKRQTRCLSGDHLTIPGPRFLLILDDFRDIIQRRG